jgi:hypothetical protein
MHQKLIAAAATLVVGTVHGSETIRCGTWVVDASVTVDDLLRKCGEPASKRYSEQDVRTRNAGGGSRKIGTTVTEYWTYDRGSRASPVLVTIIDGKVRSIERVQ